MKKANQKGILLSLLFGCIAAIVFTWLMLNPVLAGTSMDALDLQPIFGIWLCCAICFTMIILSVMLSRDRFREAKPEGTGITVTEKLGIIFQVISLVMALCMAYDLFPARAEVAIGLLLLYLGVKQYMQTRSRMGIALLLWGIAVCIFCLALQLYNWSGLSWIEAPQ